MDIIYLEHRDLVEALEVAINALQHIKESDPGAAYYIAKEALEQIETIKEREKK